MWNSVLYCCSSDSASEEQSTQMEVSKLSKEKQQLMSEVDERKRKMLREVEVCCIHTQCYMYMYIYSVENVCTCIIKSRN